MPHNIQQHRSQYNMATIHLTLQALLLSVTILLAFMPKDIHTLITIPRHPPPTINILIRIRPQILINNTFSVNQSDEQFMPIT